MAVSHSSIPDDLGVLLGRGRVVVRCGPTPATLLREAAIADAVVTEDDPLPAIVIAHLAGALGVRVWILLPFFADWRWMLDRPDTPWYPTARLIRQPRRGDWVRVFQSVTAELASATPI